VRSVVASFPSPVMPAPLPRRALAVFGVASMAVASMAVGLGLAFPGGIGSRSGSGAGVSPIYVTPARSQARPEAAGVVRAAPRSSSVPPQAATTVLPPAIITPITPVSTPTTTPPDVVNQVNQQVTDVLDGLFPAQNGKR
jgi:hypothetical protein